MPSSHRPRSFWRDRNSIVRLIRGSAALTLLDLQQIVVEQGKERQETHWNRRYCLRVLLSSEDAGKWSRPRLGGLAPDSQEDTKRGIDPKTKGL